MIAGAVSERVEALVSAVDDLLAGSFDELEPAELVRVIEALEVQRRRLAAVDQLVLAVAAEAGVAGRFGHPGLAEVLVNLLQIDPRQARARVHHAEELGPRRSLTGDPLPPLLEATAAAAAAGQVSAEQVEVIGWCLDRIPPDAPAQAWPVAERLLLEAARVEPPRALRRTAAALLARLDPDGLEPEEEKAQRRRGFSLVKHQDGTSSPRGTWTVETTELWEAILDALAAPQPADEASDPRTPAQRRHDAMAEAAARLLRSNTLPAAGGMPVTVLATISVAELAAAAARAAGDPIAAAAGAATAAARSKHPGTARDGTGAGPGRGVGAWFTLDDLAEAAGLDPVRMSTADAAALTEHATNPAGLARLGHGATLSARALLAIACEGQVVPVIFNDAGGIVAFGDSQRLASRGQRLALAARDGGCCFPGCDRPAAWTEVHHIIDWIISWRTDLDNLCLLCRYHHRSFEKAGWTVRMHQDGLPEWLPPPWLDPEQRPRRNTAHHRPELDFRLPQAA
jgi:hypothetical protein